VETDPRVKYTAFGGPREIALIALPCFEVPRPKGRSRIAGYPQKKNMEGPKGLPFSCVKHWFGLIIIIIINK
jgi:hypothetical protein